MAELTSLIVDEGDIARDELAVALKPYVRFTREGRLLLEPSFDDLPAADQVLCVLLALQAAHMLDLRDGDTATPAEIVEASGMAAGTVRPKLSSLLKSRRVAKVDGGYRIPVHSVRRTVDALARG